MKIGFVGLGHMGNPMVKNLLKAGFDVTVYDKSAEAMQALAAAGAKPASSLIELAKGAEVLITMLQTGDQVKDVCLKKEGLFENSLPDVLYIDSSSIEIAASRELHHEAGLLGVCMIDAPVSGGVAGAEAGTLTFMVGGEEKVFNRAKPILEKLGKKIIHAGEGGHGQAAKICNNLILGVSMIAVSEAFTLAKKIGLDPKKFFEISSNASGQCWAMTKYSPVPDLVENVPSNNGYKAGFMAKMMLKDLLLGMHAAENAQASVPLGAVATELYSLFVGQGNGEMDFSGIIKMLMGE